MCVFGCVSVCFLCLCAFLCVCAFLCAFLCLCVRFVCVCVRFCVCMCVRVFTHSLRSCVCVLAMLTNAASVFGENAFVEENDETTHLHKKRKLATSVLSNIPILGYLLTWTGKACMRRWRDIKRRRRSYKLSLYFQIQMVFAFAAFLAFLIVSLQDLSLLSDPTRVEPECTLPSSMQLPDQSYVDLFTSDGVLDLSGVYNYTVGARRSLSCENDKIANLDAACTIGDFSSLLTLMLVTSIFFLIGMVACCLVYSGFNFFSNIPMEALDIDQTSRKVSFLSSMCRFGPWMVRTATLVNVALVLCLVLLPTVGNYCFGSFTNTHACVHMYDDCASVQFSNCRYYYSSNCVGDWLPHTSSQSDNFKQCKDSEFAAKFSGRIDARLVYPTPCSRCWALHSDCRNPQINKMRLTNNSTLDTFVYTNSSSTSPALDDPDTVGRDIQCRCNEHLDLGKEQTNLYDIVKLTNNNTNCTNFSNATSTCSSSISTGIAAPPIDVNATYWSFDWQDSVANTTAAQSCSWAPAIAAYYYDESECTQTGSTINRFVFVLGYVTIILIGILIVAGIAVRYSVQSETWSYSPHPPNEPWYWKFLRLLGPG